MEIYFTYVISREKKNTPNKGRQIMDRNKKEWHIPLTLL